MPRSRACAARASQDFPQRAGREESAAGLQNRIPFGLAARRRKLHLLGLYLTLFFRILVSKGLDAYQLPFIVFYLGGGGHFR
jgi:hypothetical protein